VSSPNAALASRFALASASPNCVKSFTTRMPRPPPPALALISSGVPMASASARSRASL